MSGGGGSFLEPVYDIVNCGPRNRFCTPWAVAHNCLGLGFGCGAKKFVDVARIMSGLELSVEEATKNVAAYRASNRRITSLWRKLEGHLKRHAGTKETCTFELPSGRTMNYHDVRFTGELSAVICRQGVFQRNRLWGGVLTENCLTGDTQVLTQGRGWVELRSVTPADLLWDGEEFVAHGGLVSRGEQDVIPVHGVWATKDHEFLSTGGWVSAEVACTLPLGGEPCPHEEIHPPLRAPASARKSNRPYGGDRTSVLADQTDSLESEMCVRGGNYPRELGLNETVEVRKSNGLRQEMPPVEGESTRAPNSRNVAPSGIPHMEVDERPLPPADSSGVEKLRREGDHCLLGVEGVFSELLAGYGWRVEKRAPAGSDQQRRRLLTGKLPVGYRETELPKQAEHVAPAGVAGRLLGRDGRRGNEPKYGRLPSEEKLVVGRDVVYDVLNCGPRTRFAVRGGPGQPVVIAHNCVQAIARDIVGHMILELDARGVDIRLHVHDEIVALVDEDKAEEVRTLMEEVMSTPPPWIADLPVATESEITTFYKK